MSDLMEFLTTNGYPSAKQAHVRYMFRGHGDNRWKLAPGVYRPDFSLKGQDDENARLRAEQHLFQDFAVLSAGLRSGRETDCDLYALQQHHGMPTRLLDWSNNALAALYFAVADRLYDEVDGTFTALDAYELATCQGAVYNYQSEVPEKDDVRGVATFKRRYLRDAVDVISKWKEKESFGKWAIALRPYHEHTRMALQRSCFTFHVPERQELDGLECVKVANVEHASKPRLRRELAALGIDDFSLFGDMDHLARSLKSAYLQQKS